VVRRLAGKLTDAQAKQLKAIVEAEHEARHGPEGASIRLATDFHVLLAEMTGKPILICHGNLLSCRPVACCLRAATLLRLRGQRAS
jgi:DNA-binding FadR family transcriptional regulator